MRSNTHWITGIFFLLTFFATGGSIVESFVNYPTWLLIGADHFQAYHHALGPRIVLSMVLPMLLSTIVNGMLFWYRPEFIPRWSVWASLLLVMIGWIATALIQIPIQIQLGEGGFSPDAIRRLISTDLITRVIPAFIRLAIAFWMLLLCLKEALKPKTAIVSTY